MLLFNHRTPLPSSPPPAATCIVFPASVNRRPPMIATTEWPSEIPPPDDRFQPPLSPAFLHLLCEATTQDAQPPTIVTIEWPSELPRLPPPPGSPSSKFSTCSRRPPSLPPLDPAPPASIPPRHLPIPPWKPCSPPIRAISVRCRSFPSRVTARRISRHPPGHPTRRHAAPISTHETYLPVPPASASPATNPPRKPVTAAAMEDALCSPASIRFHAIGTPCASAQSRSPICHLRQLLTPWIPHPPPPFPPATSTDARLPGSVPLCSTPPFAVVTDELSPGDPL